MAAIARLDRIVATGIAPGPTAAESNSTARSYSVSAAS
jgi:hypothetical protein